MDATYGAYVASEIILREIVDISLNIIPRFRIKGGKRGESRAELNDKNERLKPQSQSEE